MIELKDILMTFLINKNDDFNQTIAELKLREFQFYADRIDMDRYYYNLLFIYYKTNI